MLKLSIREMRAKLGMLAELLDQEGEIVVTRRGEAIARVLPIRRRRRPDHADLRASLPRLERSSEELIRSDRDER
jgi:antitoxin (DNA-binding transcriptional repressor) of toxin-antitoxin stability system